MSFIQINNGSSVLFWQDKWGSQKLIIQMPELFSFVKNKFISAQKALSMEDFNQLLHRPISESAFLQLQELMGLTEGLAQSQDQDNWTYGWGNNFSSAKAYKIMFDHQQIHSQMVVEMLLSAKT
jgi:hypothetical protein